MNWTTLSQLSDLPELAEKSHQIPCLIFKHSTKCSISYIVKHRLESNWPFSQQELMPYYLDLIAHRAVSNGVADFFQVHHESPQVILVWKGEVLLDASHLDISVEEMMEVLAFDRDKVTLN